MLKWKQVAVFLLLAGLFINVFAQSDPIAISEEEKISTGFFV